MNTVNPLNNLNTLDLLAKIESFKKLDLKTATMGEISSKLNNTLSCMAVSNSVFHAGTHLYRIRKLEDDLSNQPKVFQDIWHPTAEMVKVNGRVNQKGQPMLYTSTDQITPVYECDVKENNYYTIIQYTVKHGQRLVGYCVGSDIEPENLSENGKINYKIINDFIVSEFVKPVGKGTEYLYKISNAICQNFMDMPGCDAYVYPSIAYYKKGLNVAIKPESARQKIIFDCALICISKGFDTNNQNYTFELKHRADRLNGNNLVYTF